MQFDWSAIWPAIPLLIEGAKMTLWISVLGLAGGLGGFLLPIMFGMLEDFTGIRSTSFMLLYGTVCVSLIWMHFSFKAKRKEIEHA